MRIFRRLVAVLTAISFAPSIAKADGGEVYQENCASCHEAPIRDAIGAADLRAALPEWEAFSAIVRSGQGVMPSFPEAALSHEELEAAYVYLGGELATPEPEPDGPAPEAGASRFELPGRIRKAPLPSLPSGAEAGKRKLPLPPATPQAAIDYRTKCKSCHGDLESPEPYDWYFGAGPLRPSADIPNLRHMNMGFSRFRYVMERGGKGMPAFEEFTDRSAQGAGFQLFKYVRDRAESAPKPRAVCNESQGNWGPREWARMIWVRSCSRCHGRDYQGAPPAGGTRAIAALTGRSRPNAGSPHDRTQLANWLLAGHEPSSLPRHAPRLPHFSASDVEALYALLATDLWGIDAPERRTPEYDRFWRGEACHASRCAAMKSAADEVVWRAKQAGDKRPLSGTKACARVIKNNRRAVGRGEEVCIAAREIGAYLSDCGPYAPPVRVSTQP